MDPLSRPEVAARFAADAAKLAGVIGCADRVAALPRYCTGLILPGERKSVEPVAGATTPGRISAQHQSLTDFVAEARWRDGRQPAKVCEHVIPVIDRHGPIQ